MLAKAKITKGGKVSIPSTYRKTLNLKEGTEVVFSLQNNQVTITPISKSLANTRNLINQYHTTNDSLVDKLIAQRKIEAQNE